MAAQEHWSGPYRDDRMYVMRITHGSKRPTDGGFVEYVTDQLSQTPGTTTAVLLVTYRNVPSLPAIRTDSFDSIEEAVKYVKSVEPTCPRVSLDGKPPQPTPSWEEHLDWLRDLGLRSAAEGDNPRPG
jgi:hypothetical protein